MGNYHYTQTNVQILQAVFFTLFYVSLFYQVPKMKKNAIMVSLVPDDVGKPTVKLEKTAVQDGTCSWENPVFEPVKLVRDSKSGKIHEKIYHFIVSTVSSSCNFTLSFTQLGCWFQSQIFVGSCRGLQNLAFLGKPQLILRILLQKLSQ